jgi:hypothetical protein
MEARLTHGVIEKTYVIFEAGFRGSAALGKKARRSAVEFAEGFTRKNDQSEEFWMRTLLRAARRCGWRRL